jgi:hypothetical protein
MTHAIDEAAFCERHPTPAFTSFMTRYNNVFGGANTDPVLRNATDLAIVVPVIPGPLAPYQPKYQMGMRIQRLLVTGALPTGNAITVAETAAITPYAAHLVAIGTNAINLHAAKGVTAPLKVTALGGFDTVEVALNPGAATVPAVFSLNVYNLVDLL